MITELNPDFSVNYKMLIAYEKQTNLKKLLKTSRNYVYGHFSQALYNYMNLLCKICLVNQCENFRSF